MAYIDKDLTVAELKEKLNQYPDDAIVFAYEGEVCGVIVRSKDGTELGVIDTVGH